jgi:hypothetical protein
VDDAGRKTVAPIPRTSRRTPWKMLLMHEWMHEIVSFYIPAEQGWPVNDVHGGYEHGYVEHPYVNERYFTDMLQGKVLENGQPKGLLPQDYVIEGTPAHPRRQNLIVSSRMDGRYRLHYTAPPDFDGSLQITVQNGWEGPNSSPILIRGSISAGATNWVSQDVRTNREIKVCVSSLPTGSARYRPYSECDFWTVPNCIVPRLVGLNLAKARRELARANCQLGRVRHRRGRGRARVRSQSASPGM